MIIEVTVHVTRICYEPCLWSAPAVVHENGPVRVATVTYSLWDTGIVAAPEIDCDAVLRGADHGVPATPGVVETRAVRRCGREDRAAALIVVDVGVAVCSNG